MVSLRWEACGAQIAVIGPFMRVRTCERGVSMIAPTARLTFAIVLLMTVALPSAIRAQDVPGIEICTVEKTMERRTSCLQSNVDFLQKTITKLTTDHQQKLDAANSQIDALMTSDVGLTKELGDLQAASAKSSEYTM